MSYRVDIPTLSANEVYTLTFEYEGTETIQLIVGDLTLETTDRRVVFTTTSPVNYIESNMNLINLNIYEGYYESDDFGGEYTQESYIEGMSLVNLCPTTEYVFPLDANTRRDFVTFCEYGKTYTIICKATFTDVSSLTRTPDIGFIDATGGQWVSPLTNFDLETGLVCSAVQISTDATKPYKVRTGFDGTIDGIMVLEGDKIQEFLNGDFKIFSEGIGCVKSPTIISHEDSNDLFYIKDYTCTVNGGTVYSRNGKISFSGYFWTYTNIDIINGGVRNDKPNCYYEPGTYYLKAHYKTTKPKPNNDSHTANFVFVCADGTYKELIGIPNISMGGTCNTVQQYTLTVTSPIVKIYYKIWYGGTRDWVTIENVSISKVYREYTQGEEDNAILETSVVSTPDDLELYSFTDTLENITITDSLDLTTGTVTKNIGILDITDINTLIYSGYDSTNDLYNVSCSFANFPNIVAKGNSTLASSNILEKKWYTLEGLYSHGVGGKFEFRISGTRGITSGDEAKQWVIDNLIMFYERTPEIIQLDINPLKSYRNGSITTSSQQLAPTLKTTLPISNKFTTTNLTSGQTYNIYFDGTATKLDAGGTIITNPVSPCEVECGGTTLTIEGTDIQNVRVIETSVKNEVGNNSTSDVELTKIVAYEHNNIASNVRYSKNSYEYQCSVKLDNTNHSFTISGGHSSSHGSVNTGINYPSGISLVHIACDIAMPSENLMANIHFGNGVWNSYQNFQNVTLNNDTATIKQTTQRFSINNSYKDFFSTVVTGGHYSNLMYVVSKNNVQTDESFIITVFTMAAQTLEGYTGVGSNGVTISNLRVKILENYPNITTLDNVTSVLRENDGSTIIWEDMDLTFIQNISDLEQPIKLRSLGTTYDSYNPVTGELTKRIGVSETDGSYSVLSSPIASQVKTTLGITNIRGERITLSPEQRKHDYLLNNCKPNTDYFIVANVMATESTGQINIGFIVDDATWSGSHVTLSYGEMKIKLKINSGSTPNYLRIYANSCENLMIIEHQDNIENKDIPYFEGTQDVVTNVTLHDTPHLYTNGQVKVYSESDVYPTTILNGQSTNNYEVNELNKSNNYTIRYEGECESINLNGKSNEQGTNRIVKTSTNGSGNLTFVNDSGDIDNVLLVQNDVREQEINHFNGLQTVEVSGMMIETSKNMWWNDWITPSQFDRNANHFADSAQFIPTNGGETIYLIATEQLYYSLVEFDENYNRLKFNNVLIANPQQSDVNENGYYKNYIKLQDNTKYVKFVVPVTKANTQTTTPIFTYSKEKLDEPILSSNAPYQSVYINLPQPVQLNSLPDGTCDTYNPITGEYVQNVGYTDSTDYDTYYQLVNPIITQLTPINIPTFEGGILQLITTDGKVFPMIEYSMLTNNRYDTSSWETGVVYTQRNMTEAYFNESTTPMTPTETMTLTTDHISSGSIILNDNGNGLIVLNGNYTGRDIPYFTGMRSVEAIEVETTTSPDQPLFGKGGRK